MKKNQSISILACFGMVVILYLVDLSKIITSAGNATIHIYPVETFILLGLFLLWRAFKQRSALR